MDNGDSQSDPYDDRAQLFDALSNLSPSDFERLLVAVNMPHMNRVGGSATVGAQVSALLDWADSFVGPGLSEIQNYLDKLKSDGLPTAFDFSKYLQFVYQDPRYEDVRDLYTETEVLIRLEAETVEQQSPTADGRRESEQSQQKVERFPVLEGLRKHALGEKRQHLLLAGRPGSGKSTTLKRLLLELADSALGKSKIVPVYVQLKGDRPITDLIIAEFRRAKVRVTLEQLDDWLLQDRLLLLLDGVNEIPSDEQRRKLQEFREDNSTTPMVFTTRDLAVGGDLGIEKRLEMRPLSEPQMREFVKQYLPDHADTLLRQLKDRLREVAETPLLLKMLCDVFDPTTGQIPQSKGELFRLFDAKYDQFKGLAAVSADFRRFKPELLRHLAFCMMQGDPAKPTEAWLTIERNHAETILEDYLTERVVAPGQWAKEWLEDLLEHHLLQVATDPREIEFHHQLFQEYYAAEELLLRLPELLKDENTFKQDYLNYLKWTEPIALMLALVSDEAQALRVVKLAMDDVDLMLGSRLAGEVSPTLQPQTIGWIATQKTPIALKVRCWAVSHSEAAIPDLLKALENSGSHICRSAVKALGQIGSEVALPGLLKAIEHQDPDVRRSVAYALGQIGSEVAVPILLKAIEGPDSDVRRSAVEALGQIGSEVAVPILLKAIEGPDSNVRRSAVEALGQIGSEVALPGLLKALEDRDFRMRWRAGEVLGQIGREAAMPGLLKAIEHQDPDVRESVAEALGQIGGEAAIPGLLKVLEDPDFRVRRSAALASRNGGEAAVPSLMKALEDPNSDVRESAAEALGQIGSETAIPSLLQALADPDPYARSSAALALGEIGSEIPIPSLLQALKDPDPYARRSAVEALGQIGSTSSVPSLLKALKDVDSDVRSSSAEVLGQIGGEAAIPALLKALEDPNSHFRRSVVEALREIGSETAISGLMKALEDPDPYVCRSAAYALGQIGSEAAILTLLKVLEGPDPATRSSAAAALGQIGRKAAILGLMKALEDPDPDVRSSAAYALGEIGSEAAIPGLLKALADPDPDVRSSAAYALEEIGSEAAIPDLLKALADPDPDVRRSTAYALGKIGSESRLNILWQLHLQQPENHLGEAISAIQDRCKFYNYEIWQEAEAIQNSKLEIQKSKQGDSSGQAINQFPNTTEVKIFERVEHYHEHPPDSKP